MQTAVRATHHAIDALLGTAAPLARRVTREGRLRILAYHEVPDPGRFRDHLDHLMRHCEPETFEQVAVKAASGTKDTTGATLLTFDDGYRSVFEVAFPLLRNRGIPAIIFIVPSVVGTDTAFWWDEVLIHLERGVRLPGLPPDPHAAVRALKKRDDAERRRTIADLRTRSGLRVTQPQLTWDEIREMDRAGWEIGNHSWSHPCLDRCADEVIEKEIRQAHERISSELGHPPRVIAYPNGDVDARTRLVAAELGYQFGFLFDHRLAQLPLDDRLRISRIRADASSSLHRFKAVVSGLHPFIHHRLGRT